jgi:proteasome lid subunit RPN8/RPN11
MTILKRPRPLSPARGDSVAGRPLTFAPLAWLKLQYLCHAGPTEVGGFGLSHADDLLHVEDILVVRQRCTLATVIFDDDAVADLFDDLASAGVPPNRFARIWLHTHPGASVAPSGTDEATFARAFGTCDWAVMAILGRTGLMSARLKFTAGPGAAIELATRIDWPAWPDLLDATPPLAERVADWQREYAARVEIEPLTVETPASGRGAMPCFENLFRSFPLEKLP